MQERPTTFGINMMCICCQQDGWAVVISWGIPTQGLQPARSFVEEYPSGLLKKEHAAAPLS